MQINYYDPTMDAPFDERDIPYPGQLETDEDFTQLFQYMISEFHLAINIYGKQYGYGDRQRLLATILMVLTEMMPMMHPEYISNYPASLEEIKRLVAHLMLMSVDYTGMHPEEETA
jgi:hypothetical protein